MQDTRSGAQKPRDLEDRTVRALTRKVTVIPEGGDIYSVTTESGSEYRVDHRESRCTCPDYQYRDHINKCYHVRRVEFAVGDRPIPAWANRDAVDPQLGEHVSGPEWASMPDESNTTAIADGGALSESSPADRDSQGDTDPCECDGLSDDGPECWHCYRKGQ